MQRCYLQLKHHFSKALVKTRYVNSRLAYVKWSIAAVLYFPFSLDLASCPGRFWKYCLNEYLPREFS